MAARAETLDAQAGAAQRSGDGVIEPSAPVTGWRRLLGDWGVVCGSSAVCQALGVVTSVLLRIVLDPAQMGIWQALKLFLSYGNYANLGISKGAVRELTVALGRNDTADAERGLHLAFTVNTMTSLAYAAVLTGAGIWVGWRNDGAWTSSWAIGLVVVGGLAALSRYVTFHVTILRARQAFTTTSKLSILEAVLTLIVCVATTWLWGLAGLYAGTLVVLIGSLVFVLYHKQIILRWAWDWARIRRLVGIGGPILLAGTVSSLFRSLDKLMILGYLSDREFQLGCYSVALMVTAWLYGLGNMLSIVMGPRYGEKYGQSGSRREVARLAARSSELQAAAIALPAAVGIVAAPAVLSRLLPDYRVGLAPLVWLVPGVVALLMALPAAQYLVAVDRQKRALAAVVLATLFAVAGNHVALTGGYGLVGVAVATAAAYGVYFVLVVGCSLWMELGAADRFRYGGMLALTLVAPIVVAIALERLWPSGAPDWIAAACKTAIVTLVWSATVVIGWRLGGWRQALRKT